MGKQARSGKTMEKNQKSLAIIDDGVYGVKLPEGIKIIHLIVSGGRVTKDKEPTQESTHGALCAAVILRACPQMPIISIKIMEQGTAGDIRRLSTALNWCLENNVSLVHMSLGTLVYELKDRIEDTVRRLLENGTLMVAAFHNRNIPTWPAVFPGVFGVRADKRGVLENRDIAFDRDFPGSRENSLIACISENLGEGLEDIRYANSFAAPVVTAKLARMVLSWEKVTFEKALAALEREAATYQEGAFEGMYCRFPRKQAEETEIPVLWTACELLAPLSGEFKEEGYDVTVFSDCGVGVPLAIYGQVGYLREGFPSTMSEIYPADALLLCTRERPALPYSEIDMYVAGKPGEIRVFVETGEKAFQSVGEVFFFIKKYFA